MRISYLTVLIAMIALVFSGCDVLSLDDNTDSVGSLIEENEDKWQRSNLQDYNYTYALGIGERQVEDVEVFVRSGQIDSVAVDGVGIENPASDPNSDFYITVDQAFVRLEDAYQRDTDGRFSVRFNDLYGFPSQYRAFSSPSAPGEELIVRTFDDLAAE